MPNHTEHKGDKSQKSISWPSALWCKEIITTTIKKLSWPSSLHSFTLTTSHIAGLRVEDNDHEQGRQDPCQPQNRNLRWRSSTKLATDPRLVLTDWLFSERKKNYVQGERPDRQASWTAVFASRKRQQERERSASELFVDQQHSRNKMPYPANV